MITDILLRYLENKITVLPHLSNLVDKCRREAMTVLLLDCRDQSTQRLITNSLRKSIRPMIPLPLNPEPDCSLPDNTDSPVYYRLIQTHLPGAFRTESEALIDQMVASKGKPVFFIPVLLRWHRQPGKKRQQYPLIQCFVCYRNTALISCGNPISGELVFSRRTSKPKQALLLRRSIIKSLNREHFIITGAATEAVSRISGRILRNEYLLNVVDNIARTSNRSKAELLKQVKLHIGEIATQYRDLFPRLWKIPLQPLLKKCFKGIEFDSQGLFLLRDLIQKRKRIVLIPNHRSHFDYIAVSYGFYLQGIAPPVVAAGQNLAFWPMGYIFRNTGAFFIRRSFRGLDLYPAVFKTYVKDLLRTYRPIEFFFEGGRSRNGLFRIPKLGLIGILLEAFQNEKNLDLYFVPVSINYDRIIEEESYVSELSGRKKKKENLRSMIQGVHLINRNYGKVYVSIGNPLSLHDFMDSKAEKSNLKELLALEIFQGIAAHMPVTAVSVILSAIMSCSRTSLPMKHLRDRAEMILADLAKRNMKFSESLMLEMQAGSWFTTNLQFLVQSGMIIMEPGSQGADDFQISVSPSKRQVADYLKNTLLSIIFPVCIAALGRSIEGDPETIRQLVSIIYPAFSPLPAERTLKESLDAAEDPSFWNDSIQGIYAGLLFPCFEAMRAAWIEINSTQGSSQNFSQDSFKAAVRESISRSWIYQTHPEVLTTDLVDTVVRMKSKRRYPVQPTTGSSVDVSCPNQESIFDEVLERISRYRDVWTQLD